MKAVARIEWSDNISRELGKYIAANEAVVVSGIPDCTPLGWSISSLESRYGDSQIRVVVSDTQEFKYDEKKERDIQRMSLSEFIDKGIRNLGADGKYYALGRGLSTQFEGLTEEIELPKPLAKFYGGMGRFVERNVWMSHGGTRTALHFDTVENFNMQVEGEKRFWLHRTQIKGMYPLKLNSQASYLSQVDPRHVDREAFPDFREEGGIEAVTREGDMLYLPYGWWHQVDTTGEQNLNVNFWWVPRWKLLRYWPQSLRGAFVLAHRFGKHPHARAEDNKEAQPA
jgi:lysine-specific demethylase 8